MNNEQGAVYKLTTIISGKHHTTNNTLVKDKPGNLLTTEKVQEMGWTIHSKKY